MATTVPERRSPKAYAKSFWLQSMMAGFPASYFCIKAFSETDLTEDLKRFDVPTLVLHGDDDQIVPYADSALLSSKDNQGRQAHRLQRGAAWHVHHAEGPQSTTSCWLSSRVDLGFIMHRTLESAAAVAICLLGTVASAGLAGMSARPLPPARARAQTRAMRLRYSASPFPPATGSGRWSRCPTKPPSMNSAAFSATRRPSRRMLREHFPSPMARYWPSWRGKRVPSGEFNGVFVPGPPPPFNSWSKTLGSTLQRADGGSADSSAANPRMRRSTGPASPATRPTSKGTIGCSREARLDCPPKLGSFTA